MYIAIAPSLLQATRMAMLLWALATNGNTTFIEVPSCAPYEARNEACISIFQTSTLPAPYAGKTWRWQNQYVTLVLEASPLIVSHEIGHALLGMNYHATPNTSIMSPVVGDKCLTEEDAHQYYRRFDKPLKPWCLP